MRMVLALGLAALSHWGSTPAAAQEKKPRTEEEIRKDLEQAQKKVNDLGRELAEVINQKAQPLPDDTFKVGAVYQLFDARKNVALVKAKDVIGPNEVLVQLEIGRQAYPTKFLMRTPTAGIADGAYIPNAEDSNWKVTGTKKVSGVTVFVLETAGPVGGPGKK